jgi:O-antigen/teichoic acid export membrane protein
MIDKIKSLSKDTLVYGTSTILGRFLNFVLVPFYTNRFIPEEYGVIAIIYAYIAIFNVFFSVGLESGFFKFSSTLEAGNKKENFSQPFIYIIINSFFLGSLIYFLAPQFSSIIQVQTDYVTLIKYAAIILFLDTAVVVPFAYLRLNNKAKVFATLKIINIVTNVALNFILIIGFGFGIEAVFISNIAASLLTLLLLLPVIIKNFTFSFNKTLAGELFRFSIPTIPAGIAANIINIVDRPILKYLTDDETVGIYQANYKLGIFMMLVVSMFEFAWKPFYLNNAKDPNAKQIFSKVLTVFILFSTLVFLFLTLFIEDIVKMPMPFDGHLIGEAYWSGLSIVPVILFSYILYGIYINFMAGIYIEKKTKYLPLITGIAAGANIVFNLILIPVFSIMGAAISTLLSYFIMMAGMYIVVNKFYRIRYEYEKIIIIFLSLFLILGIYFSFADYLNPVLKLLMFGVFASSLFIFKIVNFSTLKKIFKKS